MNSHELETPHGRASAMDVPAKIRYLLLESHILPSVVDAGPRLEIDGRISRMQRLSLRLVPIRSIVGMPKHPVDFPLDAKQNRRRLLPPKLSQPYLRCAIDAVIRAKKNNIETCGCAAICRPF